jgi:hydrogenase/urease accessory protein HupE
MTAVRKKDYLNLSGWSAVGVLATIAITKALTALVMSLPIAWLVNRVFAAGAIHAIFGADRLSYWRCVGLFAISFAARVKIKFSGPSQLEKDGNVNAMC